MMIKLVKPFLFIFLSVIIIFSCVKEEDEGNVSIQERILKAYIDVYHKDNQPTASGIYLIDSVPGTGAKIEESEYYAYVRYTTKTLDENYLTYYTSETIAKQLGTYAVTNIYGSHVWPVGKDLILPGREELIKKLRINGTIEAIIPPTLLDEESGADINSGEGSNIIYDIELDTFVVNIENYQIEQLENYSAKYYGNLDSLEGYKGFYFHEIHDGGYDKDTIPDEETLNIRYIGRLLDGQVFGTNITDSLIKYNLPTSSDKAMPIIYMKDFDEAKEKNPSIAAHGFLLAIQQMGYKDKCITFFSSDYGYGNSGSINPTTGEILFPGYYPMFYELWIENEPADEDE